MPPTVRIGRIVDSARTGASGGNGGRRDGTRVPGTLPVAARSLRRGSPRDCGGVPHVTPGRPDSREYRCRSSECRQEGRSALGARRSALGARRSALGARRSALGARRSALGARRSALGALGARRSALGARRSALGARRSALVIMSFILWLSCQSYVRTLAKQPPRIARVSVPSDSTTLVQGYSIYCKYCVLNLYIFVPFRYIFWRLGEASAGKRCGGATLDSWLGYPAITVRRGVWAEWKFVDSQGEWATVMAWRRTEGLPVPQESNGQG